MKKLFALLAVAAIAGSASAKEMVGVNGEFVAPGGVRASDIELEYDGGIFFNGGTSPSWTDLTSVTFEIPAGGPYILSEVRLFITGTQTKTLEFYDGGGLFDPPNALIGFGPDFSTPYGAWPPADWTTVDLLGLNQTAATGDLIRPTVPFYGTLGDAVGLAYANDDGNPGHSWAIYQGNWTDDTYAYGVDDGFRLGINEGNGTPTEETSWGAVKNLYR